MGSSHFNVGVLSRLDQPFFVSFGPFGKKGTLLFLKMCSFLWLGGNLFFVGL